MDIHEWILEAGVITNAFPINPIGELQNFDLQGDLVEITNKFNKNKKLSPFLNTGLMIDGKVSTMITEPNYEGKEVMLRDIIENGRVDKTFFPKDLLILMEENSSYYFGPNFSK